MKLIDLFEDNDEETDLDDKTIEDLTKLLRANMLRYNSNSLAYWRHSALLANATEQDIINILNKNKDCLLNYLAHFDKESNTQHLLYQAKMIRKLGLTWPELDDFEILQLAIKEQMNSSGIIDQLTKEYDTKLIKPIIEKNKHLLIKKILQTLLQENLKITMSYIRLLDKLDIHWPEINIIKRSVNFENLRLQKQQDEDDIDDW